MTAGFRIEEYLALQRLVYLVGEAVRQELTTERLYLMSLGSQSGNRHVRWHVGAAVARGPVRRAATRRPVVEARVVAPPDHDMADLARRLRARVERIQQGL